jgi:hypothetical protein
VGTLSGNARAGDDSIIGIFGDVTDDARIEGGVTVGGAVNGDTRVKDPLPAGLPMVALLPTLGAPWVVVADTNDRFRYGGADYKVPSGTYGNGSTLARALSNSFRADNSGHTLSEHATVSPRFGRITFIGASTAEKGAVLDVGSTHDVWSATLGLTSATLE